MKVFIGKKVKLQVDNIWKLLESVDETNNIPEQKFKLIYNKYGNKKYESDLFIINSYDRNSPNTSWKESGYELNVKPELRKKGLEYRKGERFSTLKELKTWLKTDDAFKWYSERKK